MNRGAYRHRDHETQKTAALTIDTRIQTEMVLHHIRDRGGFGSTDCETRTTLGLGSSTPTRRQDICKCKRNAGPVLIMKALNKDGRVRTRPNPETDKQQIVWIAVEFALPQEPIEFTDSLFA